ncbi:hypothetical protein KPH14_004177 [Odynerus spinipes]|uniref:Uncharacterized protein n=1 Tax=Odynerus spinipes TaxID=1348599 RepID=A0AAD9VV95_9HYME|nr:hypothetical protein KPH14_004177 [Odynerus spinipes]
MKHILLIATIQGIFVPSDTIGGVIWSKSLGTFVPIFSVQPYSRLHWESLSKQREAETHNFQGRVVRFSYFQKNNIVDFTENNTKVSGLAGDVWNLLASTLNFTLKPIHSQELTIGSHVNGSYYGLLGELQRNETDIIPRVEMFSARYTAGDFTPALWNTLQRLYVQLEFTHNHNWIIYLFSWKVWYSIVLTYFVLTICTHASQMIYCRFFETKQRAFFADHCFYNFAMLCKQGCIPDEFNGKSRILEVTLGLFTSIIHIGLSALIFNYMTNEVYIFPFEDIKSLIKYTTYDVITVNGSIPHLALSTKQPIFIEILKAKRFLITQTDKEMYEKACSNEKKYALFTAVDLFEAEALNTCKLRPVGKPYYATWIASSINKGFKYKRTIDVGIIKLHEFGFISRLKAQRIRSG